MIHSAVSCSTSSVVLSVSSEQSIVPDTVLAAEGRSKRSDLIHPCVRPHLGAEKQSKTTVKQKHLFFEYINDRHGTQRGLGSISIRLSFHQ